jgi:hypothetical protein
LPFRETSAVARRDAKEWPALDRDALRTERVAIEHVRAVIGRKIESALTHETVEVAVTDEGQASRDPKPLRRECPRGEGRRNEVGPFGVFGGAIRHEKVQADISEHGQDYEAERLRVESDPVHRDAAGEGREDLCGVGAAGQRVHENSKRDRSGGAVPSSAASLVLGEEFRDEPCAEGKSNAASAERVGGGNRRTRHEPKRVWMLEDLSDELN